MHLFGNCLFVPSGRQCWWRDWKGTQSGKNLVLAFAKHSSLGHLRWTWSNLE